LATRSRRRGRTRSASDDALRHLGPPETEDTETAEDTEAPFEDVEARAARLGVTVEKVLREYAHIAFAIYDTSSTGMRNTSTSKIS
jgi:hypothetical protein